MFSWQLIEDNLQISMNAENSGHLNFPKYFDISMSNLQSQTFRFKLCTFFAKNAHLFPFMQKMYLCFLLYTYILSVYIVLWLFNQHRQGRRKFPFLLKANETLKRSHFLSEILTPLVLRTKGRVQKMAYDNWFKIDNY